MKRDDVAWMRRAVRIALRGHGGAGPNPLVGCVLVDAEGRCIAEDYHRRFGTGHAEARALERAGSKARGATAFVSLEPCGHHGQTPPCADALIAAGVTRVVYATPDPNPIAAGGARQLADAGVAVERISIPEAELLNEPFLYRIATALPWTVAKWAQSIDGRIAARGGDSKWISSDRSRRWVHRERGRSDAILIGYGTALADDPLLTARHGRRRRIARRIVVDPRGSLPPTLRIFDRSTVDDGRPTIVATLPQFRPSTADVEHAHLGPEGQLAPFLRTLAREQDVAHLLVEGGGRLIGQLVAESLLNEAIVFVAPLLLGDPEAPSACRTPMQALPSQPTRIEELSRWRLLGVRRRGDDAMLHYRRPHSV